jgi:hypothetical protein
VYRFTKHQIRVLVVALGIAAVEWSGGNRPDPTMAFVATCCRFSQPRVLCDLADSFGYSPSYLSRVTTDVCLHLVAVHGERLRWHPRLRQYTVLRSFARALASKRCPSRIWGFIDGHFVPFSRPKKNQRWYYSGYKKVYRMNWQVIVTPDGLMNSVIGPFEGKANDWGMYSSTRISRRLERMMGSSERPRACSRRMLYLYGDSAYNLTTGIVGPFGPGIVSQCKSDFNTSLSAYRISVEWAFREIFQQFIATAFAKGMKIGKQPVTAFFLT